MFKMRNDVTSPQASVYYNKPRPPAVGGIIIHQGQENLNYVPFFKKKFKNEKIERKGEKLTKWECSPRIGPVIL